MNNSKTIVHSALLLALAIVLQALRLVLPIPQPISTIIIGSLVNMILAFSCCWHSLKGALTIGAVLPVFAYFQGQLLWPLLIPIVILGNTVFILLCYRFQGNSSLITKLFVPAMGKALLMLCGTFFLGRLFLDSPVILKGILIAMSVPQFITAVIGGFMAIKLGSRVIFRPTNRNL